MTFDRSRRDLLRTTLVGAALGAAALRARAGDTPTPQAKPEEKPVVKRPRLRKAVKWDMVSEGDSILAKFQLVKECGFEGVEIDSPLKIDRDQVVAASKSTGVLVHGVIDSIHWVKRFSDPDTGVRDDAVQALRGAIKDAKTYGATTVLVVPGAVKDPESENREQVWARSQNEIKKAIPDAKAAGVKIAIEVVWNDFLLTPEDLIKYVDEFDDPTVGAYFDASNMVKYGVPSAEWVRKLGKRMLKLDFKGYSKKNGWCAIGKGDEDWPEVVKALAEIGYAGFVTAEVDPGGREHLMFVSKKMDQIFELT